MRPGAGPWMHEAVSAPRFLLAGGERQLDDALPERASLDVAEAGDQVEHSAVVAEDPRTEARDAIALGRGEQLAKQDGAQPAVLPGVLHREGDLGTVRLAGWLIAGHGDHGLRITRRLDDERKTSNVVHVRQEVSPVRRQPSHGGKESLVARILAEMVVELDEPRLVVGADRPHPHPRAVAQHDLAVEARCAVYHRLTIATACGLTRRMSNGPIASMTRVK